MARTNSIDKKVANTKNDEPQNEDQIAHTAWEIGEEARWLQEIAERDNLDFLSYLLKLVVLETELAAEKSDSAARQSKVSKDGKLRLIR